MAKYAVTRKNALDNALVFCNYANVTGLEIEGYEGIDWIETARTLAAMKEQISKPRAKVESKAHHENANSLTKVLDLTNEGDVISTKWVIENIAGVMSAQKASAILMMGVESGNFVKVEKSKPVTYERIA